MIRLDQVHLSVVFNRHWLPLLLCHNKEVVHLKECYVRCATGQAVMKWDMDFHRCGYELEPLF